MCFECLFFVISEQLGIQIKVIENGIVHGDSRLRGTDILSLQNAKLLPINGFLFGATACNLF